MRRTDGRKTYLQFVFVNTNRYLYLKELMQIISGVIPALLSALPYLKIPVFPQTVNTLLAYFLR